MFGGQRKPDSHGRASLESSSLSRSLGAQVNVHSRRRDAQAEFLTVMEDAIRKLDLPQIKSADAWLMLLNMVIDISSTVGNNSQLRNSA